MQQANANDSAIPSSGEQFCNWLWRKPVPKVSMILGNYMLLHASVTEE